MKIRGKFKAVTPRLFAITQVYGAELDFGMAAQRDTATVIEWKSSDDVMIRASHPYRPVAVLTPPWIRPLETCVTRGCCTATAISVCSMLKERFSAVVIL